MPHWPQRWQEASMTEFRVRSADDRRQDILLRAAKMGIDEAFIGALVDTFYTRVRAHPVLGPVFGAAITDWDPHLARMKDFWSSVALNSGRYSGRPVPAHKKHPHIQNWHFNIWLALFHQTLIDTAKTPDAVIYFMERAERIGRSVQRALFDDAVVDPPLTRD
jgi:hemoglobin